MVEDELRLSADERRVFRTLADMEPAEGGGVREDDLARAVGLERATFQAALSALVSRHELVRELPAGDPDLGPHYSVKDNAASA